MEDIDKSPDNEPKIEENKSASNTKRIAKNTLMLYFRQILIMLVSLYTVRVVLNVLGAEDYGIYNVVAGVVVLFSFVNNAMATSTQRFINYSLGENNLTKVTQVYSASLVIHGAIAFIFLVLAETVGLWFVSCKLNIPSERHSAALWAYQFSIISTIFTIFRVPYNATIIAYERMSFFAFLSIVEAFFKLIVVFLISSLHFDKLAFYSFLLCMVSALITLVFKLYCNVKIETAKFSKVKDKTLVKELFAFSGWNLFGASANVANQQGANIVLNMFTNVTVNAAMGIANQVNAAVYSFVSNFQTAFNPQLVKSYAAGEKDDFMSLLFRSAKLSFFLLLVIVVPLYVNVDFVLSIWLKNVPQYSVEFVRLILIWSLIDALNGPLWMAASARGNIKNYQVFVSIFIFLNLPLSILLLALEFSPVWVLYIRIAINVFLTFWRLFYLKRHIGLIVKDFIIQVISRCLIVCGISFVLMMIIANFFDAWKRFFITVPISILFVILLVFCLGFTRKERNNICSFMFRR